MKRLVFCFDGTWNKLDAQYSTNVVLTAESVLPLIQENVAQVVFYDEGVGTSKFESLSGGMFGAGLLYVLQRTLAEIPSHDQSLGSISGSLGPTSALSFST